MIEWFFTSFYVFSVGLLVKETAHGTDWTWSLFSYGMTFCLWFIMVCFEIIQYKKSRSRSNKPLRKFLKHHFTRPENIFQVLSLIATFCLLISLIIQLSTVDMEADKVSFMKKEKTVWKNVQLMNQSFGEISQSLNCLGTTCITF